MFFLYFGLIAHRDITRELFYYLTIWLLLVGGRLEFFEYPSNGASVVLRLVSAKDLPNICTLSRGKWLYRMYASTNARTQTF